jgi:hypothetical protein
MASLTADMFAPSATCMTNECEYEGSSMRMCTVAIRCEETEQQGAGRHGEGDGQSCDAPRTRCVAAEKRPPPGPTWARIALASLHIQAANHIQAVSHA